MKQKWYGYFANKLWLWLGVMDHSAWSKGYDLPCVQDDQACLRALGTLWDEANRQLPKRTRLMMLSVTLGVCGANDALGFMTVIDGGLHTARARVKEAAEVSIVDARKFQFMIDEVPNFALYIMKAMAHRIRGMREAM